MKITTKLNTLVTAVLYTEGDVPFPHESPLLVISSMANASEGLGGYGPPDEIMLGGKEALQKLGDLLSNRILS